MPKTHSNSKILPFNYSPRQDKVDWLKLGTTLIDNKGLIAFITVAVLTIGVAQALLDEPVYKADALLHIKEMAPFQPLVTLINSEVPVMADIELIKSRRVLGAVVKKLNLDVIAKPKYFPVIGEIIARRFKQYNENNDITTPLFGQSDYAWGGESIKVDVFTVPSNWVGKELILITEKQGHFRLMNQGDLVLEGDVGKLASNSFEDKQHAVTLLVSLLKSRPGSQFIVMRQAEGEAISQVQEAVTVTEKGQKTGVLALTMLSTNPNAAFQILNEVVNSYVQQNIGQLPVLLEKQPLLDKEHLPAALIPLIDVKSRDSFVNLTIKKPGVSKNVVDMKVQMRQLRQQRHELRQIYSRSYPPIVAIDKKIYRLQGQIDFNNKKIEAIPKIPTVVPKLAGDVTVNALPANNSQALEVAKADTAENIKIIDYAILPTEPIKSNKTTMIAISLLVGLTLGVILAFIRQYLFRGLSDPDLIEKQLNIPVYIAIPHSEKQARISTKLGKKPQNDRVSILALESNHDAAIESLRSLRTTLHFVFLEAQSNIIMITSPSPGVGKSFVAINLAAVLADAGKKVLLIDGDLRKGFLHNALGVSREKGLSEFISNTVTLDSAVQKIPTVNFDFIATGSIPPKPSELLLDERFSIFLDNISKHYDYVFIDSPPVLAVTDAAIIGRMASATLMVIKAGKHPLRELEQSVKRLLQAGVNIDGIVVNDVSKSSFCYGLEEYSNQKTR